jgi:hypothetical protein
MPLSYAVSREEKLVRVRVTGSFVSEDMPKPASSPVADIEFGPGWRYLVDATDVQPDVTFTDLQNAAGGLTRLKEKGVGVMAIVTGTTHVYALAQVFAVFAPPLSVDVKVFRRLSEATAWLKAQSLKPLS